MNYVWDNANIVESYPGICSPLTFSFARYVYREVYLQTAPLFGVERQTVEALYRKLETFLGYCDGRFYYNLETWCSLISYLPGFGENPKLLQEMMGVLETDRLDIPRVHVPKRAKIKLLARALYFHAALPGMTARWIDDFDESFRQSRAALEPIADAHAAMHFFFELEQRYLRQWKIPILNDFAVMIYSGILRQLSRRILKHELDVALLGDIGQSGNIRMVSDLRRIAAAVRADKALYDVCLTLAPAEAWQHLQAQPVVWALIERFLAEFGLRNGHDLKLETANLREEPARLAELLQQYLLVEDSTASSLYPGGAERPARTTREAVSRPAEGSTLSTSVRTEPGAEASSALEAQARTANVPRWQQALLDFFSRHTRRAIARREEMRVKRSQVFGMAREIFLKIGAAFAAEGILDRQDDVFYLEMEEVFGVLRGTATLRDVRVPAAQRKSELEAAAAREVPPHFTTVGVPFREASAQPQVVRKALQEAASPLPAGAQPQVARMALQEAASPLPAGEQPQFVRAAVLEAASPLPAGEVVADANLIDDPHVALRELTGNPNYAAVVTGEVIVMERPDFAVDVRGKIIVCRQTDPSWVPLLGLVRGIIVERGGILSHAAIVCRELRVPSIIGAAGATRVLHTGQRVRLDSAAGKVTVL